MNLFALLKLAQAAENLGVDYDPESEYLKLLAKHKPYTKGFAVAGGITTGLSVLSDLALRSLTKGKRTISPMTFARAIPGTLFWGGLYGYLKSRALKRQVEKEYIKRLERLRGQMLAKTGL